MMKSRRLTDCNARWLIILLVCIININMMKFNKLRKQHPKKREYSPFIDMVYNLLRSCAVRQLQ